MGWGSIDIMKEGSRLDVELRAPPVTPLGVVLWQRTEISIKHGRTTEHRSYLDLIVSLETEPLGDRPKGADTDQFL